MRCCFFLKLSLMLAFAAPVSVALADPPGQIAAGKTSVTLPFVFSQNHIIVSALVNGKGPFSFILDSGAEWNVLDKSLVRTLNLKTRGGAHLKGFGSQIESSLQTENTTIQIGDATLPEQKFVTYDFSDLRKAGSTKFAGILGRNVFNDFVVQVDYDRPELTMTLPTQFAYHGPGVALPITFNPYQVPQIDGKVEGIAGKFNIDTGDSEALTLYTPFVEKNSLRAKYASQSQTFSTYGAGGTSKIQLVPSLLFQFGGLDVHLPVEMSQAQSGLASETDAAGNIGGWLLRDFNLTFDYSRSRIIFEMRRGMSQPAPPQATAK